MLAYCPAPLPDEILPGVFSRLADIVQYPRRSDFSIEIYGRDRHSVSTLLTGYLDDIVAALPMGHPFTVDRLIREHTLFPLYEPFLPAQRSQRVRKGMQERDEGKTYQSLGISGRTVPAPRWLRFCYECVTQDKEEHGVCYWHRVHQVPGVKVCPKHGTLLQDSQVPVYQITAKQLYISAERALEDIEPEPNNLTDSVHQILLRIAKDAYWLLCQNNKHVTLEWLQERLRIVFTNKELITFKGGLRRAKFLKAFHDYYSAELLDLLDCPVDYTSHSPWPIEVVHRTRRKHPLHYLLVIYSLGYTLESFFTLSLEVSHFGKGPWPCLNPVCKHYRQPVIDKYQASSAHSAPQATFACGSCGFVYRRLGPDSSEEDQYRISSIVTRGPVWEAALQQMLNDPTLKISTIARELQVNQRKIVECAAQYKLSSFPINENQQEQAILLGQSKTQEMYRDLWQAALKQFPKAKVSELTEDPMLMRTYHWLLKHDRKWYEAHKPKARRNIPQQKVKQNPQPFDRYRRNCDVQLAENVCRVAAELLNQADKPIRITRTSIFSRLGQQNFIVQLNNYPLTSRTLTTLAEPYEVYAIRVIEWLVANYYQEKGPLLTKTELMEQTGLVHFFSQPKWEELAEKLIDNLPSWDAQTGSLVDTLLPLAQKDWAALDVQLPGLIQEAARQLVNQPGYPIKVTAVTIGVEIDRLEEILRDLYRLPQTAKALAGIVETNEAFVARVVDWVLAYEPGIYKCRSRLQFVKLAGLQSFAKIPIVENIINEAFAKLQTQKPTDNEDRTIDWLARDKKLALAIQNAATMLRAKSNPFVRITRISICQVIDESFELEVAARHLIQGYLDKLPEATRVLNEVLETFEQFAERCLNQIAEHFRQKGVRPTREQLRRSARATSKTQSPQFYRIFNKMLESLESLPSEREIARKKRWEEIDRQLSNRVKTVANQLKEQHDPLIQVTWAAISRYIGVSKQFMRHAEKLPKTAEVLVQVSETAEEFAIRRIRWCEAYYQERKICPSRKEFIKAAGLTEMIKRSNIKSIVAEVLQTLASLPPAKNEHSMIVIPP